MPYIKVGEENEHKIKLYYEDYGVGKPVVMMHGWPLDHQMWERQVPPLIRAGYRVITHDRRGFGLSSRPWSGYDYDTFAADVHSLITDLDLNNVTLVGFSMGGGEVARYVGNYGTAGLDKLVLISAVPPFLMKADDNPEGVEPMVFQAIIDSLVADRVEALDGFSKTFFNWQDGDKNWVSKDLVDFCTTVAAFSSPKATIECVRAFSGTDFREDITKIDIPLLIIHGDKDNVVPLPASSKRTHAMLPDSHLEVIAGAPHGITYSHAYMVNQMLLRFLQS